MSDETVINPANLKVVELREELANRGLDTKGLKKDLVDRLTAALDLSISGGSTAAPPNDEMKDMAQPIGRSKVARLAKKDKDEDFKGEDDGGNIEDQGEEQEEVEMEDNKKEEAVGHSMVEGTETRAKEIDKEAEEAVSSSDIELEPACLDSEVAAVVAKEEAKALLPPTPPEVRSTSPLPASRQQSPRPVSEDREMSIISDHSDDAAEASSIPPVVARKRSRSRSPTRSPSPQRQKRRTDYLPLPSSLSHLIHPPTSTLYITNLRRPLVHSALHDHLFPDSTPPGPSNRLPPPRQPFAGEVFSGLWLSGVKDHAYAVYPSEDDALEAAERIEGVKWPEDTGAKLHVEFVQDDLVMGLVEQEERAWANGRQKLALTIEKDTYEAYRFELSGGALDPRRRLPPARPIPGAVPPPQTQAGRRIPIAVPLSGPNFITPAGRPGPDAPANAPTGPSRQTGGPRFEPGTGMGERANFNIRGRGGPGQGYGMQQQMGRGDNGYGNRAGNGQRDDREIRGVVVPPGSSIVVGIGEGKFAGRLSRPLKRTKERPYLTWREGPGAVASIV